MSQLWHLTKQIAIQSDLKESATKISNIANHLYVQISNDLHHGLVQDENTVHLEQSPDWKIKDIAASTEHVFLVDLEGAVHKCSKDLEKIAEITLLDEYQCPKGHIGTKCKMKVTKIACGEFGVLFITDCGSLWAMGKMPQIGIFTTDAPRKVTFFHGRRIHSVDVGADFAIAIVSKQLRDDVEEEVFISDCSQCKSCSELTSPDSISELCPLGMKIHGSYDIETTSTSSKNDSSLSLDKHSTDDDEKHQKKNIIFRNTEAAKEFLTRQISRMSSVGEEYLVECTEKPTRLIKENMTNVASFVYEGVKNKVVTLSRHVSGSSDCNSVIETTNEMHRSASKEDTVGSLSQSEKDFSEAEIHDTVEGIIKTGTGLLNCEVWTWGNIFHGQLGIGDKIRRERPMIITKLSNIGACKVSVQNHHAAVLTLDGRTYLWGRNDHNQVTLDNGSDQSSPKLYTLGKDERIKDVTCGEFYTVLLNNHNDLVYFGKDAEKSVNLLTTDVKCQSRITLHCNVISSLEYTLYNTGNVGDNFFNNFLQNEQRLIEEMLLVQQWLIKPLQKKSVLYENLCQNYLNLLQFLATNLQSLLEYNNGLCAITDVIIFRNPDEFIFVYKTYLNNILDIISIDAFPNISKLIEISPNLYKHRSETFPKKTEHIIVSTYLQTPLERVTCYTTAYHNLASDDIQSKFIEFSDNLIQRKLSAETTRDFWLNSGKTIEALKTSERRLIRDSHKYPIHLLNASRFTSHWFVLFSDVFVHVIGSTSHVHGLETIWIEPHQDETMQQHQITLKMPEDCLVLYTNEAEAKIEWFHTLQSAIKLALNKCEALQPPAVRNASYVFTKNANFLNGTYTGRWLNGKMHGSGKLQWSDGKTYSGMFSNNQISGNGIMVIPNVGTYEGQWKENQQNGLGVYTYTNTDVYKGFFKDGVPHGHGFLRKGNFMANAASFYIGDWINGLKNGYGVMDDISNGEKYIGNWQDNKRHGIGLIITSDGTYYEGTFNQDVLTGQGLMILEDGTQYEGEFRGTGIMCGRGTLRLTSGHTIEGTLNGSWDDGIKISNGTLIRTTTTGIPQGSKEQTKWKSLFKQCHQVLGIPNGTKTLDTQKIWQNVAVYLSNSSNSLKRGNKFQDALNHLDIIPPFGREKLDVETYLEVKNYLAKAFENGCHPIGSLLNDLSEAYNATYGGSAHPLLLSHAINELHYICKKLYEIVRFLFPALPCYEKDCLVEKEETEEIVNYQSLLYPLILPKVHHPLFTLFTLKNEQQERQYKRTLMEWNKMTDFDLMIFLSVDKKFYTMEEPIFEDAIETLQQLKSTFSPTEKLLVIRQTVEKMTPVAQCLLGENYVWNMDDLFPIFLFVVVRSRIPDLGSELDFVDNFMDPSLESGELGIMYTTLKASYQQILQEKVANY